VNIEAEPVTGKSDCGAADPTVIGVQNTDTNQTLTTTSIGFVPGSGNCKATATLTNVSPATEYDFYLISKGQQFDLGRIFALSIYQNTVNVKIFNTGLTVVT